jgi:hypothetical protein
MIGPSMSRGVVVWFMEPWRGRALVMVLCGRAVRLRIGVEDAER